MVVVTAFGGGILAGAWVVKVLTELFRKYPELEKSVGLISAVSGGSVGTLFLVDRMLQPNQEKMSEPVLDRANDAVRASTLESVAWDWPIQECCELGFRPWFGIEDTIMAGLWKKGSSHIWSIRT